MVAPPPPTLAVRRAGAPPPPPFGRGAARRGTCPLPTVILHYMSRQKLLKIQTCKKCRAAVRIVTSAALQQEDPGEAPWKKAKLELLTKHGSSQNDPSREIQQYRCLAVPAVDPLEWWRSQTETYRRLSHLARAVLAIPATSAPSERIFSAAGVVLNCKRSSLSPNVVDKVIFVHENGHLLEDV